jgi:hypothetical protein
VGIFPVVLSLVTSPRRSAISSQPVSIRHQSLKLARRYIR